jgi:intein/homing endonuclease
VWDANNKDDYDIYDYVSKKLETESTGPVAMIKKAWKSVKQLDEQRKEFTRELAGILSRVGRLGALKDYVSIGDNGKIEIC